VVGYKFKKKHSQDKFNVFSKEKSVDGCSNGWVENIKRIKISKLLDFVAEHQPTTNRHSGHLRQGKTEVFR